MQQRDVGCLLLADHPRHNSMELLYLGLIPAARGRGWGKHLVRRAQGLTRLAGRSRLVLAVDAANAPAVQTYTATGFQAWQRRRLYVEVSSVARQLARTDPTGYPRRPSPPRQKFHRGAGVELRVFYR